MMRRRWSDPERREPGFQRVGSLAPVRAVAERLEVAARPFPEPAGEVVRAGALAPEHPAVGVEQERDGAVGDLAFEDAEAVGAAVVAGDVDLAAFDELLGGDRLGVLGADRRRARGAPA